MPCLSVGYKIFELVYNIYLSFRIILLLVSFCIIEIIFLFKTVFRLNIHETTLLSLKLH